MSHTTQNLYQLWEKILFEIAPHIPKSKMLTWFRHTALFEYDEKKAVIGLSREFYLSFHEKNTKKYLIEAFQKESPFFETIEFVIDGALENEKQNLTPDLSRIFPQTSSEKDPMESRKLPRQSSVKITKDGEEFVSKLIDTRFSLQNYVIGEENQLAHAACQAVANNPGGAYNPLFIYGSVGLGKTHLLQATANEIIKKDSKSLVVYLTTENFIAEVVEAIQKRKMEQVRKKYRKVDIFILDDIQFLAGKDRTQEIFFHLFNDLYAGKKQMIFSSDRPPLEMELTEERLKSRFSMGMIADVKFPDFETRLAICKIKSIEAGIMLDEELLNFIAQNIHYSIRELEGVIVQTKAIMELTHTTPSIKSVANIIKSLNKNQEIIGYAMDNDEPRERKLTTEELVEGVSGYYGVSYNDVIGTARKRDFMIPRQVSMFLLKKHQKKSFQSIGEFFSGRDHTSVMHAVKKIEKKRKDNPEFWREMNTIEKELRLV
jgi:chromosomal replication initiator protein